MRFRFPFRQHYPLIEQFFSLHLSYSTDQMPFLFHDCSASRLSYSALRLSFLFREEIHPKSIVYDVPFELS